MNISGSSKISVLDFKVLYDLSGAAPKIILTNLSSGPDLTGCKFWAVITTPSASIIHTGSLASPDMLNAWATWTMPETWPQVFMHVEWSGAPYTVQLWVNDGTSTYGPETHYAEICPPRGNNGQLKHNFGIGAISTTVKCNDAQIFAKDGTNYMYKTSMGTLVSQSFVLTSPADANGNAAAKQIITGTPYAYFTVTYNGSGYQVNMDTVRDYTLDANSTVRFKYKAGASLNVMCGMDLCSITCGYQKLLQKLTCMPCADAGLKDKATIIGAKINLITIGVISGCPDVDISAQINDVKKLLGEFDCCCGDDANSGIFPTPNPPSNTVPPLVLPVLVQGTSSAPPPCPNSFFPAAVYAPDGVTLIGVATDAASMISIINGNAEWAALGQAVNEGNCTVGFIKADGVAVVPPVYVTPGVTLDVFDIGSGAPPAACPASYFPATVYAPDGVTPIGTAASATAMVAIINANAAWQAYGTAYYNGTNCTVAFIPGPGVDPSTIPPIVVGGTTGCVGGIQHYTVTVEDICGINTPPITTASFPLNAWVDFGSGLVSLGSIANNAAFIAALNGATGKPGSVTFSAGPSSSVLNYDVDNTDCAGYSGVIKIYTDTNSAAVMLYAANHKTIALPQPNVAGVYGVGLKTSSILGQLPGLIFDEWYWHCIKVQGNYMFFTNPYAGSVFCWDITNPLFPVSLGSVALPDTGGGNCFTGLPQEWGVNQYYSLYFPTDYHNMNTREVYVVEARTGSIWHVDFAGTPSVPKYYQDQQLIGMCPRIHEKGFLWFTQDGDMKDTYGPGVGDGVVIRMNVSAAVWDATTLLQVTIIPNFTEEVWAASFDGTNSLIYFSGQKGTIVTYSVLTDSIVNSYPLVMGRTANRRLNTKFYNNKLYHSTYGGFTAPGGLTTATRFIDTTTLGGTNTITNFQPFLGNNATHWNFLPIGNCNGILTYENGAGAAGFALFKLDGTYISNIPFTDGAAYNAIAILGVATYTPNSLI